MEKMMEKDPKGVKTLPTIFDFYTEVPSVMPSSLHWSRTLSCVW